jgi:hypothetical protein
LQDERAGGHGRRCWRLGLPRRRSVVHEPHHEARPLRCGARTLRCRAWSRTRIAAANCAGVGRAAPGGDAGLSAGCTAFFMTRSRVCSTHLDNSLKAPPPPQERSRFARKTSPTPSFIPRSLRCHRVHRGSRVLQQDRFDTTCRNRPSAHARPAPP